MGFWDVVERQVRGRAPPGRRRPADRVQRPDDTRVPAVPGLRQRGVRRGHLRLARPRRRWRRSGCCGDSGPGDRRGAPTPARASASGSSSPCGRSAPAPTCSTPSSSGPSKSRCSTSWSFPWWPPSASGFRGESPVGSRTWRHVCVGLLVVALVAEGGVWVAVHAGHNDSYQQFLAWEPTHVPQGSTISVTEDTAQFLIHGAVLGDWYTAGPAASAPRRLRAALHDPGGPGIRHGDQVLRGASRPARHHRLPEHRDRAAGACASTTSATWWAQAP